MRPPLLIALFTALALAGCGGDGDGGNGGAGGPVSFQVFGDAEELAVYREMVGAYQEKSGRRVRLIEVADRESHLSKLTTSFAADRAPDVFLVNYRNFGPFAARRVLDPVGPRLDASRVLQPEDFYEPPLESFTTGGVLQCLPQNASSLVVYVNRDLFRQTGVAQPRGEWTWEQFRRAAVQLRDALRRRGDDAPHPLGVDPGIIRLAPFIWSAGGELVDDEDAPTGYTFRTPEARRGIDRFLSLYREGLVPTEVAVESEALDARFIGGRLAMFMSSRREVPAFRQIEGFDWDVASFPTAERAATVLHSDAFCLAEGRRAGAAWEFLEFAGGPEGQEILSRGGRIVPSLREVAESPDFLRPDARPESAQVFLDAIPHLRRLPNNANWPRIEDAASLAFKRAFYAEMTVEQAIDRIEAETRGLF